jgi:hypothetical protein
MAANGCAITLIDDGVIATVHHTAEEIAVAVDDCGDLLCAVRTSDGPDGVVYVNPRHVVVVQPANVTQPEPMKFGDGDIPEEDPAT